MNDVMDNQTWNPLFTQTISSPPPPPPPPPVPFCKGPSSGERGGGREGRRDRDGGKDSKGRGMATFVSLSVRGQALGRGEGGGKDGEIEMEGKIRREEGWPLLYTAMGSHRKTSFPS